MRKLLILALMAATAATPALAQRDRGGARGAETRGGEGYRQRAQQAAPAPQAQPAPQARPAPQAQQSFRQNRGGGGGADRTQGWRGNRGGQAGSQMTVGQSPRATPNAGRNWRGDRGNGASVTPSQRPQGATRAGWQGNRANDRQGVRGDRGDGRQDYRNRQNDDRGGYRQDRRNDGRSYQAGSRGGRGDYRGGRDNRWDRGWRNDRRYDWQNYRNQYRNLYRAPRYYSPRGWGYGYQRFSIGLTLNSLLYGSDYWIDDPYYYRLPPAEPGLRWVRYYNDVMLVDEYSGEVVDVIYDFFY